jgi:hypothetical protein
MASICAGGANGTDIVRTGRKSPLGPIEAHVGRDPGAESKLAISLELTGEQFTALSFSHNEAAWTFRVEAAVRRASAWCRDRPDNLPCIVDADDDALSEYSHIEQSVRTHRHSIWPDWAAYLGPRRWTDPAAARDVPISDPEPMPVSLGDHKASIGQQRESVGKEEACRYSVQMAVDIQAANVSFRLGAGFVGTRENEVPGRVEGKVIRLAKRHAIDLQSDGINRACRRVDPANGALALIAEPDRTVGT